MDLDSGSDRNEIDRAAQEVVERHEILLAAPNDLQLTSFYATPDQCSSTIAQAVCNSGQLFVRSNSLAFGSSSNFQISSGNIVDSPVLQVEIVLPEVANAAYGIVEDGWLFAMIKSFEVSYSNSNLSHLILKGKALRDWVLAQCRDEETRKEMLINAGRGGVIVQGATGTYTLRASLPLSFLNWESANVEKGFPFDARTINGIIQIQVNWESSLDFMMTPIYKTGQTVNALPSVSQFNDIRVSFRTYQLMDSAFAVGNTLARNPTAKYALPAKWLNSFTYTVDLTATPGPDASKLNDTLAGRIELTSAPAGMLQGIIFHARPIEVKNAAGVVQAAGTGQWAPGTATAVQLNRQGSLRLRNLLLQYSGQNIIQLRTEEEIDSYMQFIYGDSMKTKVGTIWGTASAVDGDNPATITDYISTANPPAFVGSVQSSTNYAAACAQIEHQSYVIPLMHNGKKVMRERHFENLPQYSGSALTLEFQLINESNYYADRQPAMSSTANWQSQGAGGLDRSSLCPQKFGPMFYNATGTLASGTPANYYYSKVEVTITYIIAAVLQNSAGMMELQI